MKSLCFQGENSSSFYRALGEESCCNQKAGWVIVPSGKNTKIKYLLLFKCPNKERKREFGSLQHSRFKHFFLGGGGS
jgi:hypothetical protein